MRLESERETLAVRLAAGIATIVALLLCGALAGSRLSSHSAFGLFWLVVVLCGSFVLFARGVGGGVGAGIGLVIGLTACLLLVQREGVPWANRVALCVIGASILGLLGHLAGTWQTVGLTSHTAASPATERGGSSAERRRRLRGDGSAAPWSEQCLSSIASDFFAWVETDAGPSHDLAPNWPAYDQFVRQVLRERLGAAGARVFNVPADGTRLEPMTTTPDPAAGPPPLRDGLIGHVLTTGCTYVAGDDQQGELVRGLEARDPAGWTWLLPLQVSGQPRALVALGRVDPRWAGEVGMANGVRALLQLFWAYVQGQQALQTCRHTDASSGILHRAELLARLHDAAADSARDGEPLMVLAIGVEGLRRMDDSGLWSQRDELIRRLGQLLRNKVRSDDVLGRFSDDRFVVVLRRLDSALGRLIAEKLLDSIRTQVLAAEPFAAAGLGVRGSLAGSGMQAVDGKALLERALGLLEYGRRERLALTSDLMAAEEPATRAATEGHRPTDAATAKPPPAAQPDAVSPGAKP